MSALKNDIANGGGGGVSAVTNGTTYASGYLASIASSTITINTPNQSVNTNGTPSFTSLTTPNIYSSSAYATDNTTLGLYSGTGGIYMNGYGTTPYTFVNGGNGTLATLSTSGFTLNQGSLLVNNSASEIKMTATGYPLILTNTDNSSSVNFKFGTTTSCYVNVNGLNINTVNKGITFNKSGASVNSLLNDYQEGTFTPVWNSVIGTVPSGYTLNYVKVGKSVTWSYQVPASASTFTCTNNATYFTLPFALTANSNGLWAYFTQTLGTGNGQVINSGATSAMYPTAFTFNNGVSAIIFSGSFMSS